jgi:hypothetical protein
VQSVTPQVRVFCRARGRDDGCAPWREVEENDVMRMREIDVQDYARQLWDAHGDKAVVEAAQKACVCEEREDNEQAQAWRHIEAVLKLMRGPHES